MTRDATAPSPSNGDPNISRPLHVTASTSTAPTESTDPTLLPNGTRSLSSIALHAFSLGLTLSAGLALTLYSTHHSTPIWRLPSFITILSLFHFLEFYITAAYNTPAAQVSSFLLFSNGAAYTIAHSTAMLEIAVTSLLFPDWQARFARPWTMALGLLLVVVGQTVRTTAMAQAGTNFNHVPARQKREGHELVTEGVYGFLRHPSYFGFFWWALGTQVLVGNVFCGMAYAVVLWRFFNHRIVQEEQFLVRFFGDEYVRFRERTGTGIPGIR